MQEGVEGHRRQIRKVRHLQIERDDPPGGSAPAAPPQPRPTSPIRFPPPHGISAQAGMAIARPVTSNAIKDIPREARLPFSFPEVSPYHFIRFFSLSLAEMTFLGLATGRGLGACAASLPPFPFPVLTLALGGSPA